MEPIEQDERLAADVRALRGELADIDAKLQRVVERLSQVRDVRPRL